MLTPMILAGFQCKSRRDRNDIRAFATENDMEFGKSGVLGHLLHLS